MPGAVPNPPPPPPAQLPPVPSVTAATFPVPLPVMLTAPAPGAPPLPVVLAMPPVPSTPTASPAGAAALPPPPPASVQNIGQTIGGPGQLVGNVATLIEGGPAGAMVAAAKAIQDQVEQALKSTISGIGEALQSVAALDGRRIVETVNSLTEKVPLVGPAIAEVNRQMGYFVDALDQTARRLGQFSPQLAVAQANAEIAQTLGDIRRAQTLGSGLARFTQAESNLSQAAQDTLAELLRPLLPIATNMLNHLTTLIREIPNIPADVYNFFVDGINRLIQIFEAVYNKLPGPDRHFALLERIARNTQKDEGQDDVDFLKELLELRLEPVAARPPQGAVVGLAGA